MDDNNNNNKQPLLLCSGGHDDHPQLETLLSSSFTPGACGDIPPIAGARDFLREFRIESRKLWYLAGPAIFTSVCQYSLGAVTQVFAGHVSTLALAAVSVENSVIVGFSFGILVRRTRF